MFQKTYLLKERYEKLKKELEYFKGRERRKIAKRLKEAKELGDLSENSEYQEARNDKTILDQKINQLEEILRNAEVIKNLVRATRFKLVPRLKLEKMV